MNQDENRKMVLDNDNKIKLQVPLILTDRTGVAKPQALRNEELFYRMVGR